MKKVKKIRSYLVAGLTAGSMIVASTSAFADTAPVTHSPIPKTAFHGHQAGQQMMLDNQAQILGITSDDLKARMAAGKNFNQIATDLGLTSEQLKTRMQALRQKKLDAMKASIQAMVASGTITQAEADARIARLATPPQRIVGAPHKNGSAFNGKKPVSPKTNSSKPKMNHPKIPGKHAFMKKPLNKK